jgi:hypothetical protein
MTPEKIADVIARLMPVGGNSDECIALEAYIKARERSITSDFCAENKRLRLALEEIVQSADLDLAQAPGMEWFLISSNLIDRARAALLHPSL